MDLPSLESEVDYVYRTLRRHGVGVTDAEDLTQDVLLVAWRRRGDFDSRQPLRPWLAGIAHKLASQHHRRKRPPLLPTDEDVMDQVDLAISASEQESKALDAVDARALVLAALARLPERHRSVLVLHDLDGLPVQALAATLGVPRFTLYTRIRRAREAFAAEVARLQQLGGSRQPVTAAGMAPPAALLALECEIPRAPAGLQRRVAERLRAEAAVTALPVPASVGSWLRRAWQSPLLAASLAGLVATTAGFWLWPRPAPPFGAVGSPRAAGPSPLPSPLEILTASNVSPVRLDPRELSRARAARILLEADELGRDLVGHWRFEDGPGSSVARDHSRAGSHCELRGLDADRAWVPGHSGGGIELGFNGWLECAQPELPRRRSAGITVGAWVKRAGNPQGHRAVAARAMGTARQNYFFFGFSGDELTVVSSGWSGALRVRVPDAVGRWMHIAFTHDVDHVVTLYVDGREVGRRDTGARTFGPVQQPLLIGGSMAGAGPQRTKVGQLFDGAIDEVHVYERALSAQEISTLAGLGAAR